MWTMIDTIADMVQERIDSENTTNSFNAEQGDVSDVLEKRDISDGDVDSTREVFFTD